jgi:hypothetical protein
MPSGGCHPPLQHLPIRAGPFSRRGFPSLHAIVTHAVVMSSSVTASANAERPIQSSRLSKPTRPSHTRSSYVILRSSIYQCGQAHSVVAAFQAYTPSHTPTSTNAGRPIQSSRLFQAYTSSSHTRSSSALTISSSTVYPSTVDRASSFPSGCRAMAALPLPLDEAQRSESGAAC